jgi:hypothetical protein
MKHMLMHVLEKNIMYYCQQWLNEVTSWPYALMRMVKFQWRGTYVLKSFFPITDDLRNIKKQFADYSLNSGVFASPDAIEDRAHFDPLSYLCLSLAYSFI